MIDVEHFVCHAQGLVGRGPVNSDVVVCGVSPGRDELRTRKVYSGETGKLLDSVMRAIGRPMESCYLTNLLCWRSEKPTMDEVTACLPRLVKELDTIKPKVIVALGARAIQVFTGVKKSGDARGSCFWNENFNCWVVSTWQPTVVLTVSPGLISDLVRDLLKIEYIKDKDKNFGVVSYDLVTTPVQAQRILNSDWLRTAEFPALDVECKWAPSEARWTDDIRCLALSDGDVTYTFTEEALEGLVWPTAESGVRWTFHNGSFDTQKLIEDQGVKLPIIEDTMLMSYSLDERGGSDDEADGVDIAVGIHGLKRLSREYMGAEFYEVDLKTASDALVYEYNAKDAAYTSRLAKMFRPRQIEESVYAVYRNLIVAEAEICRDERMHGVYIDTQKVHKLAVQWGEEWLELDEQLKEEAYKYGWVDAGFNWNSPMQLKRFLNNYLHLPVDNAQADTLAQYKGHPWVAKRLRIKKLDKQINTYVKGILAALSDDSRVHPEASIHATVSGRKSYHKPLIGTIPTGGQYMDPDEEPDDETHAEIMEFRQVRGLFGAPSGYVFIEADFKAAEGWTAAGLSGDLNLYNDLASGDWHGKAAEAVFQVKKENYPSEHWSAIRREAKYFNFGLLFWRSAMSLYSPKVGQGGNLGKKYTLDEIQKMCTAWHDHYNGHREWSNVTVLEARRTGEQRSLSGRKRRYHAPGVYGFHFQNMAANWPVQTTSHDHLILARLDFAKLSGFPATMLWDGHDAIYFECLDDDRVNEAIASIRQVMETPRYFDFGIPVEIKIGQNWADAKEIRPDQVWRQGAIV